MESTGWAGDGSEFARQWDGVRNRSTSTVTCRAESDAHSRDPTTSHMADTTDFRSGMVLEIEDELYQILDYQKVHPGKGPAYIKTELKNLDSGGTVRKRFRSGESVNEVTLIRRDVQYSYSEGDVYYFMDAETYEMIPVSREKIGEDQIKYLTENTECQALTRDGSIMAVEVPRFVEIEVTDTRPGVKGDTAQGGSKPATVASGAEIQVPLFIEEGDVIKVDREEDKYLERVSS